MSEHTSDTTNDTVQKTDAEWRDELTPEQFHVLREHGTERPGTGELLHEERDGSFNCAACGEQLFASGTKYESNSGWPSFTDPVNREHVTLINDDSLGMRRTEVRCANCGGHLGHVFPDGPGQTGERFCINSAALAFAPGATD
ncbi:MAG: peptide-methionine (R)-S-oxide reductase MsrB [Thermoleophilia bacterium]|nr:peptide-methionine (R)-S-oxide reductase MsrB [Thermoleophilia bacterium]